LQKEIKKNSMILGVCEWLSTKTSFEAKSIRIFFVLTVLLAGFGIGLYLVLWLVKLLSK
jgi:phage shock protein PspC (stress-responsive transcriptional regulator)